MKRAVESPGAPKPVGPYSQAIVTSDYVFLSGLIPITVEGDLIKGDVRSQFETIMQNARAILEQAGSSLDKVLKVTVFMTDLSRFDEMNRVYAEFFRSPYPSRTTIQVSSLPKGAEIEIEILAHL